MRKYIAAVTAAGALAAAPAASAEPGNAAPGCAAFGDVLSMVVSTYYTGAEPQFEGYRWGHAMRDFDGNPLYLSRQGLCPQQ